jgi:NADH-quinone oxidoreductase subunit N
VIVARERETMEGDDIRAIEGLGATRPWLAWPMTIAMLSLAGIPATAGFVGKFYLISATVDNGYTWLGIVIVVGSMISLAYYLRVIAAMWMRPSPLPVGADGAGPRPAIAGGSPEADLPRSQPEVVAVAVVCAAASIAFGIIPSPLFDAARDAGGALVGLF